MSDALKSNAPLTQLNLGCEHERNNTQMASVNNQIFSIHIKSTGNYIGDTGTTSLSDALKSNTTLMKLNLGSEDKRNDTQMDPSAFHSYILINREQDWRQRSNINE